MEAETTGIMISSGAVGAICTLAGTWLKSKVMQKHAEETKVPQPLVQEQTSGQAWWKDNAKDHEDIFNRLRNNESAIATLMERSIAQGKTLDRMADQVSSLYDRIICGGGKKK